MKPIELFISLSGGLSAAARSINVKPPTLSAWRDANADLPPKRCVQIEKITNGKVSRKDLRPNDWQEIWPELQ